MNESEGILSGLRVIDCGTYIAGPAAATILSDFGAEVIKIE
ncbi:MAG: CoA transferase, partial [Acidobacteriota bacterium]